MPEVVHADQVVPPSPDPMSLTDDLRQFAVVHRGHGTVISTASAETELGYDLRLRCTCGRPYYVYVTPEIAAETSWPGRNGTDAEEEVGDPHT